MSSKSRKQSSKSGKKRSARSSTDAPGAVSGHDAPAAAATAGGAGGLEIPDEILHAPKEVSKLRFALMIALIVILLIIFIVPGAVMGTFGRSGATDRVFVRWRNPDGAVQEVRSSDFLTTKRRLADAMRLDAFLGASVGMSTGSLEDQDVARFLLMDQLALDAGIRVTEVQLADHLRTVIQLFYQGQRDVYLQAVRSFQSSPEALEAEMIRGLRVKRYIEFIAHASAIPAPEDIEELWNDQHVEYAFDYVSVAVADFEEAARQELPEDSELEAWFEEQPEFQRNQMLEPERRRFRFATFAGDPAEAQALVAAFPAEEGTEVEVEIENYYNRVFDKRFLKPAAEEGDADAGAGDEEETPETEDAAAAEALTQDFLGLEDVRETATAEAPLYFAMQRWLESLQQRQRDGEEIDFAAETEQYGLELVLFDEPIARETLAEDERWGLTAPLDAAFRTPGESYAYTLVVTESDIAVGLVDEVLERALPPFGEIREEVVDLWVKPRKEELALEALTKLQEGFEEFTPPEPEEDDRFRPERDPDLVHRSASEEAFSAAVVAAGLTVERRDWIDKATLNTVLDRENPAEGFFLSHPEYHDLEADEVPEPATSFDGENAFLVRLAGERPVALGRMKPGDYDRFKSQLSARSGGDLLEAYDYAFLQETYELILDPDRPSVDPEGVEEVGVGEPEEPAE